MDMNNYIVLFPILLYVYCCNCFFLLFFTKELHFFFCFIFTFDLLEDFSLSCVFFSLLSFSKKSVHENEFENQNYFAKNQKLSFVILKSNQKYGLF